MKKIDKLQSDSCNSVNSLTTKQPEFVMMLMTIILSISMVVMLKMYALGISIISGIIIYITIIQTKAWCISLLKCTMILIGLFVSYSFGVTGIILCMNETNTVFIILLIIMMTTYYLKLWFRISMTSQAAVAKLANEFMSVITTIIFTVGTYIISLALNDVPSLMQISRTYSSIEQLRIQILTNPTLKMQFFSSCGKIFLEVMFLLILPTLCISLLVTAVIDVKDYWMKKNNYEDFWTKWEKEQEVKTKVSNRDIETELVE